MNIQSTMMNRSFKEIREIQDKLVRVESPPIFELLFLNFKASINRKSFTLAVIESFQALESFLENYLISRYREKGVSEKDIESILNQKWRAKERLKDLLKSVSGHSLSENGMLWDTWCTANDKRNKMIHETKEIDLSDAEKAIKANRDVVQWIKSLPSQ